MDRAHDMLRVLPVAGEAANTEAPALTVSELQSVMKSMLRIRLLDEKMLLLQRQGRIAFFGPSSGQEAAIVGSGFAARSSDWIFPALREGGILLMRGFPLERYFGQLFGNVLDPQQGRQQPMHFSSGEYKYLSLSSVIATQLPQAVGAAYAARLRKDDVVTFGFLGDGATSEHDFHVAMNFAGVWQVPCVIICQNNHWAISVPVEQQTKSETIAIKARAYGMPGVRVDGNDVLAVIAATTAAADRARKGLGPTFLELVTWRKGGHSSSDDPTRYRDEKKFQPWLLVDPIERFRKYLEQNGQWNHDLNAACEEDRKAEMGRALALSEPAALPEIPSMFADVYASLPHHLRAQMESVQDSALGTAEGAFPL